jgi:hypothetical protein
MIVRCSALSCSFSDKALGSMDTWMDDKMRGFGMKFVNREPCRLKIFHLHILSEQDMDVVCRQIGIFDLLDLVRNLPKS